MRVSLYSISIGLCLFHTVLGGSVTLVGSRGAKGDVGTCTSNADDNYDDKKVADLLEELGTAGTRVGNNFVLNDTILYCDGEFVSQFRGFCEGPPIFGVAMCKTGASSI
ncbi:hypothetical protein V499_04177 [Pseudogymnoascus sp. VKM F-103]|nr:hypothetical protein V499_04177 [Pseudogymnoascus sp. VKM F-103]